MKTFRFILMFCLPAFVMVSCGDDEGGEDNLFNPSPYWQSGYQQNQLNGRVKTIKEETQYQKNSGTYSYYEYNAQGCIVKDYYIFSDGDSRGITFSYDNQNRLTKIVYATITDPQDEIAEFGYSGEHNLYIPTNIYSMDDLRLNPGVTSISYKRKNKDPMTANFLSKSNNQIIFNAKAGSLKDEFGSEDIQIIVDHANNYPTKIKFKNTSGGGPEATVKYTGVGMPSEVVYHNADMVVTTKFTTIAGFLLMTSQKTEEEDGDVSLYEYTFNEKGHLISEKTSSGYEYRNTYEYDSNNNWTKMTNEYKEGSVWKSNDNTIRYREYTYW